MRLSDKLKVRRADLLDRMEALSKAANDADRVFTPDEQRTWDDTKSEIDKLDLDLKSVLDRESFARSDRPAAPRLVNERGEPLSVLRGGRDFDRLAERHRGVSTELRDQFSVGALVRGVATGRWDGRELLQRAMNENTGPGGAFTVPAALSAQWLDLARAQTVGSQAGAITIPMETQTLRVAGLETDVVPAFRAELTDFPTSNPTFKAIDLRARTIGVICEMSIELAADSPNASQMIETSILSAMGLAFDAALLKGDGVVTPPADNPRGIWNWPGVPGTATVGTPTDFKPWLTAMQSMANANFAPTGIVSHPDTVFYLAGLHTGISGDKTPLVAPPIYAAVPQYTTTAMVAGGSLVGDYTKSGWAMRESILIESTRLSDTALKKGMVQIRALARLDTFVLYPLAFYKLAGITYV